SATPLPPVAVDTTPGLSSPLSGSALGNSALSAGRLSTDDTAKMLLGLPGVSINGAGGISSLPVVHGMADDRVKIELDGVPVSSACPNHMNPVLSYITPAEVGKAEVWAGIAPVSQGGDSIGGTIKVDPKAPVFALPGQGLHVEGEASTFFRSINNSLTGSADITAATDKYSMGLIATGAHAKDYRNGNDHAVHGSRYEAYSGEGVFSVRGANEQLTIRGGTDYSPYEGFVNQPMDMTFNLSHHVNVHYNGDFDWGNLQGEVYWRRVHHVMNFLYSWGGGALGTPNANQYLPGMPMLTHGQDIGYSVKAEIPFSDRDTLRVGNEFNRQTLDDWWPATFTSTSMMGPNTFQNIKGGERNRLGTYAEWERKWDSQWLTLLGVRNDTVIMDTGNVQGYNAMMYGTDANAFNSLNHQHTDINFDVTALARYKASDVSTYEAGYARKTRSPNLYERYSWSSGMMAASMIGWFGDNQGYVGNNSLKPEVANTISVTGSWHDAEQKDWAIKATPYFTYVQNYIGADRITTFNGAAVNVLRFNNHNAEIFGIDLSGSKAIAHDTGYGDFDVKGTVGWVRGIQLDSHQSLYHMMPVNGRITLDHSLGNWNNAIDLQMVGSKDLVDATRRESKTPAFALVNFRTAYKLGDITFKAGIDNIF
ncbi:MAG: TonB-dependent receptor, partial [Rhodospirillaceae bacterium]